MRKKLNRGAVLLLVLLVLAALLIIIFSYVNTVTIDSMIAENQKDEAVTYWAARGGIELSKTYLELDDESTFDSLNEPWAQEIKKTALGDAELEVIAVDEDRKFNILGCIEGTDDEKKAVKAILMRLIEFARDEANDSLLDGESSSEEIVDNIVKWLEDKSGSDQEARMVEGGPKIGNYNADNLTEDERKINKTSPYSILTIAELLMVEGVTRTLLYGPAKKTFEKTEEDEKNSNNYFDDEKDEKTGRKPLLDFITCYSTSIRKINVNTAPKEVLMALSENMSEELAQAIVDARMKDEEEEETTEEPETETPAKTSDTDTASFRAEDITSKSKFAEKIEQEIEDELWTEISPWFTVKSTYFSVISTATAKDTQNNKLKRVKQSWRAFFIRKSEANKYTLELLIIDRED